MTPSARCRKPARPPHRERHHAIAGVLIAHRPPHCADNFFSTHEIAGQHHRGWLALRLGVPARMQHIVQIPTAKPPQSSPHSQARRDHFVSALAAPCHAKVTTHWHPTVLGDVNGKLAGGNTGKILAPNVARVGDRRIRQHCSCRLQRHRIGLFENPRRTRNRRRRSHGKCSTAQA